MTPDDYRKKHPRCRYCKYFTAWYEPGAVYKQCKVKNWPVNVRLPRGRFSPFRCEMYEPGPTRCEQKPIDSRR